MQALGNASSMQPKRRSSRFVRRYRISQFMEDRRSEKQGMNFLPPQTSNVQIRAWIDNHNDFSDRIHKRIITVSSTLIYRNEENKMRMR